MHTVTPKTACKKRVCWWQLTGGSPNCPLPSSQKQHYGGMNAAHFTAQLSFVWAACVADPKRRISVGLVKDLVGTVTMQPPVTTRTAAIAVVAAARGSLPPVAFLAASIYVLRGQGYNDKYIQNSLFKQDRYKDVNSRPQGINSMYPADADTMHSIEQLFQMQHLLNSTIGAGIEGGFMQVAGNERLIWLVGLHCC